MAVRLTVVQRLALALALTGLAAAVVTALAIGRPWLGFTLVAMPQTGEVRIVSVAAVQRSAAVPVGATLVAVAGGGDRVELRPRDLIEEPDALESYADFNSFMARQSRIAAVLASGAVTLSIAGVGGDALDLEVAPAPSRPLSSLPFAYWFQIGCAVTIAVMAAMVASLRRGDTAARLFALAGYGASMSIFAASVYSIREVAIDGGLFRALSAVNHAGAMAFGAFMIGLFTRYPKPLGLDFLFRASAAFLAIWWLLNQAQLLPDITMGFYLGILLAMIVIAALIGMQYFASRGDLLSRRALTWLGVSVLIGAGAFSVLMTLPILLRYEAAIPQAYSFGFFPLIYLGVALGLTRYRLFDLDRWAFGVLGYVVAVVLFVVVDVALVSAFAVSFQASLGITALIVGLVYLPLRNVLTSRVLSAREIDPYELFRASAEIALQPTAEERAERWEAALKSFFDPLSVEQRAQAEPGAPTVADEGQALDVPATPWSGALKLRHHAGGRRLFGAPHVRIVEQFSFLVSEAERNRRAYDRGVVEERRRIGRDLHDNVGSMLLSSLHAPDAVASRDMVRGALTDIREIVNGLSDRTEPLAHVIAHLRAETMERLDGAAVDWPTGAADEMMTPLPFRVYRAFTSAHRELVANVLRHSDPAHVTIATGLDHGVLVHRLENDGAHRRAHGERGGGNGLDNLAQRAAELGGDFAFSIEAGFARAEIKLPLSQPHAGEATDDSHPETSA